MVQSARWSIWCVSVGSKLSGWTYYPGAVNAGQLVLPSNGTATLAIPVASRIVLEDSVPGRSCLLAKDKQCNLCQALLHQQTLELLLPVLHALVVGAVHYPDEVVGTLTVVPPVGPLGLPAASISDVQL